jgi:acyl-CoA synthetase (AMP-forming)/AMP-acid ligase II
MTANAPPESLRTVTDALEGTAEENGEDTFLRYHDRRLSYAGVNRRANAVAGQLLDRGVEPGDHVCLYLYNSPEHLVAFFALAKLGAVVVPVDTRFTGETLTHVLTESDADVLLLDAHTRADYEAVRADVSTVTTEYFVGEGDPAQAYRDFGTLLDGDGSTAPAVSIDESDPITLTFLQRHAADEPHGVLMPHFAYVNTGWEAATNLFEYTADDRLFTTLPLYSIFTVQIGVMGSLLAGAEFALDDKFDPEVFWERLDAHDATVFLYLSRMLSVLYNQDVDPEGGETSAELAVGASTGFTPDVDLFERFEERFDVTILEGYGSTEVSSLAVYNRLDDRRLESVGKPPSYVEVRIVDENDRPVPTGERGEIVVRSTRPNATMIGYYDDPERTVDVCRNQWIHTGGIGYRDEDGYVYFVTTEENSIYRGRVAGRISSLEIESVINARDGVRESAVVGVQAHDGSEEILAIVVPERGVDINPVDVCKHCEQRLPYLKVPRYVQVQSDVPRTPSGKVDKGTLADGVPADAWDRESGFELSR